MTAKEIVNKIESKKKKTDAEWLEIRDEILALLKSDAPEEEKKMFEPLGYLEMVQIICNGIDFKHSE